jgi:hypothetical protein
LVGREELKQDAELRELVHVFEEKGDVKLKVLLR